MSLATRCSACATRFRVTPEQLAQRAGKVRCGKCGTVFDGLAGLVADADAPALRVEISPQLGLFDPKRTGDAAGARPAPAVAEGSGVEAPPLATVAAAESASVEVTAAEPAPVTPAAVAHDARLDTPEDGAVATLGAEAELPAFLVARDRRRSATALWSLLCFCAVLVLAVQGLVHFRSSVLALAPQTRILLETLCGRLACTLTLPRHVELMSIESSDLVADPAAAPVITLNAVIRNRAPFPQDYPALELTLVDDAEHPLVRRVLLPRDYLVAAQAAASGSGLSGGAEAALRLSLDPDGLPATGYRLYLFYP